MTTRHRTYIAAAALAFAHIAQGDDAGFYVGAALGIADHAEDVVLASSVIGTMRGSSDGRDMAWTATAGYRLSPHVAIEAEYLQLGELEASVAAQDGESDGRADLSFSTKGVALALIGSYPIGNWSPYVKAGVLFSRTKLEFAGLLSGDTFHVRIEDHTEDAVFGAGVAYDIGDHWRTQLDITYVREAGAPDSGQSDYIAMTAGLTWRF